MANFSFVQLAGNPVTGALSQTFTNPNVAGNVIIVSIIFNPDGVVVTDSQENVYTEIQRTPAGGTIAMFAAVNIKAGPNTVSATGPGTGCVVAVEYHSVNPLYFVCPGHAATSPSNAATITSAAVADHGGAVAGDFTTPLESVACFAGFLNGTGGALWTIPAGTFRFRGEPPGDFGGFDACFGDDQIPGPIIVGVPYTNGPLAPGGGGFPSTSCAVFLSLTAGCTACGLCVSSGFVPPVAGVNVGGIGGGGGGGCTPCNPRLHGGMTQGLRGLGTMSEALTRQVKQQYIPPSLTNEFFDVDETLVFNYVLQPNQTITGLEQPVSGAGDFYLCGIQMTAHNFPTFGSKGMSTQAALRVVDSKGYRLIDNYAPVGFFTPSAGNSYPYVLSRPYKFDKGTYIGVDLQEQSGSICTVQVAFRGRYRFHYADVMRVVQMRMRLNR